MTDRASNSADEIMAQVRRAAQRLVDDLRQARRQTRDWADAEAADELVAGAMSDCLRQLAETGCWGEANRLPSSELWRIAGSWLEAGTLQHHARSKPRGYAGDFEMLRRICEQTVPDEQPGRAFDRFFQQQTAPQAVRNRTALMAQEIVSAWGQRAQASFHIASVGCGPAVELQTALARLTPEQRRTLRMTALDLDPEAVEFARARLGELLLPDQLVCRRENLFRLPRQKKIAALLAGADLLGCTGLFDYLADDDAVAMLATLWGQLAPGGRLLAWNFAPRHPSQAYMEWIGNWYLTYRTADQLAELAARAGIAAAQCSVASEATGTNLVLRATREQ